MILALAWLVGCGPNSADWLLYDADGDGYYDEHGASVDVPTPYDCDDADASVHPDAVEACNGADDDCDGDVDEGAGDPVSIYDDVDLDGFGDPATERQACAAGLGASTFGTDCDDADASIHPGATEQCNGIDDDCDGEIDIGAPDGADGWHDGDGDGYGFGAPVDGVCEGLDGYAPVGGDCNAINPDVHPGAPDVPLDGVDADCDAGDACGPDVTATYINAAFEDHSEGASLLAPGFDCVDTCTATARAASAHGGSFGAAVTGLLERTPIASALDAVTVSLWVRGDGGDWSFGVGHGAPIELGVSAQGSSLHGVAVRSIAAGNVDEVLGTGATAWHLVTIHVDFGARVGRVCVDANCLAAVTSLVQLAPALRFTGAVSIDDLQVSCGF